MDRGPREDTAVPGDVASVLSLLPLVQRDERRRRSSSAGAAVGPARVGAGPTAGQS